jgi:hypothetical protein
VLRPAARAQFLGLAAAAVTVAAFFLPWMDGAQALRFHSFSGFDFARLIRNFEITAGSESESGQIRATALLIYLMPALAVNAGVLRLVRRATNIPAAAVAGASVAAGGYGLGVLSGLVFLSVVHVNDFAGVVGAPRYGFLISALGCAVLLGVGLARLPHRRPARS